VALPCVRKFLQLFFTSDPLSKLNVEVRSKSMAFPVTIRMIVLVTVASLSTGIAVGQNTRLLITNNDHSDVGTQANSATVYTIGSGGSLTQAATVPTGGIGWDGIGTAITRIVISRDAGGNCAYVGEYTNSNGTSQYVVTSISLSAKKVIGQFPGSATDLTNSSSDIGLTVYGQYLYANFTAQQTVGTYQREAGCQLNFLGDISASGLSGGTVMEMVARRNILVASFTDGSIGSFNTASGIPVPNGDLQYSTDHIQNGGSPEGIDATADGHFVIFGDGGGPATARAEVSDISTGHLTPTVVYSGLGSGETAINVRLSPDESLLYLSEFSAGKVSAAFFDKTTGTLTFGCESPVLRGYQSKWVGTYALRTATTAGSGGVVYVAEPDTYVGAVNVTSNGATCSLSEAAFSPVIDHNTITMESIDVFPPRRF